MSTPADDNYIVEKIKETRVKHGVVQYLVKWAGCINQHNTWLDIDEMECDAIALFSSEMCTKLPSPHLIPRP